MKISILVEGKTEERFVKDVLSGHQSFLDRNLFFHATILVTKRTKDGSHFKGGVTSFAKFKRDELRLLNGASDALVTKMLDYYGLPPDFPGVDSRPKSGTPIQRVAHVEDAIASHFGSPPNFVPFLVLHEFEAWIFSSRTELPRALTETAPQKEFEAIRASFATPEEINERPGLAPSKRIAALFPVFKKTLHGPTTAARIGLQQIRTECPHFNSWMIKLEHFAAA